MTAAIPLHLVGGEEPGPVAGIDPPEPIETYGLDLSVARGFLTEKFPWLPEAWKDLTKITPPDSWNPARVDYAPITIRLTETLRAALDKIPLDGYRREGYRRVISEAAGKFSYRLTNEGGYRGTLFATGGEISSLREMIIMAHFRDTVLAEYPELNDIFDYCQIDNRHEVRCASSMLLKSPHLFLCHRFDNQYDEIDPAQFKDFVGKLPLNHFMFDELSPPAFKTLVVNGVINLADAVDCLPQHKIRIGEFRKAIRGAFIPIFRRMEEPVLNQVLAIMESVGPLCREIMAEMRAMLAEVTATRLVTREGVREAYEGSEGGAVLTEGYSRLLLKDLPNAPLYKAYQRLFPVYYHAIEDSAEEIVALYRRNSAEWTACLTALGIDLSKIGQRDDARLFVYLVNRLSAFANDNFAEFVVNGHDAEQVSGAEGLSVQIRAIFARNLRRGLAGNIRGNETSLARRQDFYDAFWEESGAAKDQVKVSFHWGYPDPALVPAPKVVGLYKLRILELQQLPDTQVHLATAGLERQLPL